MTNLVHLTLVAFIAFAAGMTLMAMLFISRDRQPEREGAANFAFDILELIYREEGKGYADFRGVCEELKLWCHSAIERAELHENITLPDSTNG